jgi:penicillin amidase
MTSRRKLLFGIGATCIVLIGVIVILGYSLVTKSFPETSGSLFLPGLEHNVSIYRDEYGMAHVFAESDHDAYEAVGFLHAQERLWQLELTRRAGMGRLAEVLGEPALPIDKMFRTIGLWQQARKVSASIDVTTRAALQAYADGINAFVATHRGRYPAEFDMLAMEPEPWTVEHSLLVSRLMAWELNYARWVDLVLSEFVARFGEAKARQLFPEWPAGAPVIVPRDQKNAEILDLAKPMLDGELAYRNLFHIKDVETGSNAWVVAGKKSATGMPILANDPHLLLMAPARWFEVHVATPDLDVSGTTIPGVPFIVIGRNRAIAWGVTNAMLDDEDFYIEEADSVQHPTRYRFNGTWLPVVERVDTILVRKGTPVLLSVYSTHRGPIVNRMEPTAQFSGHLLSMRWVGYEVSNEALTFYLINRARTWSEFTKGLESFGSPAQNFVYADTAGNIGYYTGGLLPIRKSKGPTLTAAGWTDEDDWKGFVPFDQMPHSFNPREGFIATANNKIVDDTYSHYISDYWEPAWRVTRISEVLKEEQLIGVEDMARLQQDVYSVQARELVPVLLNAFEHREVADPDLQTALTYLHNWDFKMTKEDVSTTIFEATMVKIIANTFQDEMGPQLLALYDTLPSMPMAAITRLLKDSSSAWFDDVRTPERETREDIVRRSMEQAVRELRASLGSGVKEWRWGKVHQVTFHHVFGVNAVLRKIFDVGPFEVGGSHSTVWKGDFHLSDPYANTIGPSTRMIFSLADANGTRAVTPPGQSGQVFNRHYQDQIPLWLNGGYRQVPMDSVIVARLCREVLILKPAR